MKRILTILTAVLLTAALCCGVGMAAAPADGAESGSYLEVDVEALQEALGFTDEQMLDLFTGDLDFNHVDLSKVDVSGIVEAAGMTEEQAIDMLKDELNMGHVDLSGIELNRIDLGALVKAAGLNGDDLNKIARGQLTPDDLDLSDLDVQAMAGALGLTGDELLDILLSAAGAGSADWRGMLRSAGRGALIGFGAGVVVVVLIIVLLAVCGSKKRSKAA